MLDTRSKNMRRLKVAIITLVVMIPALILTALCPQFEKAANDRIKEMEDMYDVDAYDYIYLAENFPNYIVEATYCMYANWLDGDTESGEYVNYGPLEEYGWFNDYYYVLENTDYHVEYQNGDEKNTISNESSNPELKKLLLLDNNPEAKAQAMEELGYLGYLAITYNELGNVTKVDLYTVDALEYEYTARSRVIKSQEQYQLNAEYYAQEYDETFQVDQVVPKNVQAVFAILEDSEFIWEDGHYFYYNTPNAYLQIGVVAIIIAFAVIVALFALLLPFIKKLETGGEKPFSLPAEVMVCVASISVAGAVLLFEMMAYFVNLTELNSMMSEYGLKIIGVTFTAEQVYSICKVICFLGWALTFWLEYMAIASFRQFLCGPKYYIKNRFLCVRFVRWIYRKLKKLWEHITSFDLSEKIHDKIFLLVLANFVIVGLLCCGWFFGSLGAIIYSAVIYYLLKKQAVKIQEQYLSVLSAAKEIADGNLKVKMAEELGPFTSLGEELTQVQKGFSKAVMEEAKSQNMKTELITNVSHDLKTPLTAIITYVDLLGKEGITEEERKSYIATLEKKSQRLKVLIEDLFEVSKATSGNVQLHLMNVDVVNLLKQVRTEMEDKIADSSVAFRWNLPEEHIVVNLDGQKTYRVFENLLNNILKYAMPHSRAYIDVKQDEKIVYVVFRNISRVEIEAEAEHLTDRFVRGEASRNSEGSGLGLAIAKSFVELQGGNFKIEVDGDLFKVTVSWEK